MTKTVLDVCCGAKKFYMDKHDQRVLFADIRREEIVQCDGRTLIIDPDIICDFRALPFAAESFYVVVFDPPHLIKAGAKSWLVQAYGKLSETWQDDLRQGFTECFRVLKPNGALIFKWSENDIPLSQVLALTPEKPLLAEKKGKTKHWVVFLKAGEEVPYHA